MRRMNHTLRALLLALFAAGVWAKEPATMGKAATASKAPPPPVVQPLLEPRATDLLKAMSDRLAAARAMSFTALITYEHPSRLGPALAYTTFSEVLMQRPDKLRVVTVDDGPASEFYYDGQSMTAYAPAENLVAVASAPATIEATLKLAFDRAAIYFPFADVLLADPYKNIADGLRHAFYIGQSKVVAGILTDMVAFANDEVFVQIWIGAEDKLPRLLRAVYRRDPLRLRHQMELAQWQLDPAVAADAFATAKAAKATTIAFDHPGAKPSGIQPPPLSSPPAKAAAKKAH